MQGQEMKGFHKTGETRSWGSDSAGKKRMVKDSIAGPALPNFVINYNGQRQETLPPQENHPLAHKFQASPIPVLPVSIDDNTKHPTATRNHVVTSFSTSLYIP